MTVPFDITVGLDVRGILKLQTAVNPRGADSTVARLVCVLCPDGTVSCHPDNPRCPDNPFAYRTIRFARLRLDLPEDVAAILRGAPHLPRPHSFYSHFPSRRATIDPVLWRTDHHRFHTVDIYGMVDADFTLATIIHIPAINFIYQCIWCPLVGRVCGEYPRCPDGPMVPMHCDRMLKLSRMVLSLSREQLERVGEAFFAADYGERSGDLCWPDLEPDYRKKEDFMPDLSLHPEDTLCWPRPTDPDYSAS